KAFDVYGFIFILGLPLILSCYGHTGNLVVVVSRIFPRPVNEEVCLFVHEVLAVELSHFKIRDELNGIRRACFFAVAAINTAREIYPEKLRVPSAMFILRGLQRDAVDRARGSTQITSHTTFSHVGVTC